MIRYEQHHAASTVVVAGTAPIDGISVFWFESIADVEALYADSEFLNEVVPDGERCIDQTSIRRIITESEEVFPAEPGSPICPPR